MNETPTTELRSITPPWKAPALADLAAACHNGACNVSALTRALADCVGEVPHAELRRHPAFKMILGQLCFLCGESLGPSFEALHDYEQWAAQEAQEGS